MVRPGTIVQSDILIEPANKIGYEASASDNLQEKAS
jgi:hypothetical protein